MIISDAAVDMVQETERLNDSMFLISCDLGELGFICKAQGSSRKVAEQQAAKEALQWLEQHHPLKKAKK